MLEQTPLVGQALRDERVSDEPMNGTRWVRILAVVGLVVVVGLMISMPSKNVEDGPLAQIRLTSAPDLYECGATAATKSPAHVYVPGRVIGCDGPFTGGLFSASARSLCDEANGWRICTGVSDAKGHGLTPALCTATPDKKFYATQQRGNGGLKCDNTGANDVFGCGKGLGLMASAADCSPLLSTAGDLFGSYNGNPKQWSCASCNGQNELETVSHQLNGAPSYDGGVMCCKSGSYYVTSGTFYIVAALSGKALGVKDSSHANLVEVQQSRLLCGNSEKWRLVSAGNGQVHVVNENSGKVMDIALGIGKKLYQYAQHGGANQKFRFKKLTDGRVVIQCAPNLDEYVLDVSQSSLSNGATLTAKVWDGWVNQHFYLVETVV